ncbi:recombinase family protein [Alteromonadaceae bacterium M269]|nr:recombinase family protein [Alteromonadaceae bacterium M269]
MAKIGYVRTSTNKQYTDRQINELEAVCDKVYVEDGVSARNKNRPIYRQIIANLTEGDELTVMSFDRAYRSVIEGLLSLDELTERKITLRSLSQRVDPTTPDGRLFFTIIIALGEWEVGINTWRTIQGLKAAVKRGKRLGRPPKR